MRDFETLAKELRATVARLDSTLSLSGDAMVWADGSGRLVWCNATFEALVGRPRLTMIGVDLASLLPLRLPDEARVEPDRHPISAALHGERVRGVYVLERAAKPIVEVFASTAASCDPTRTLLCVARDVTVQARATEEARRLNLRLEEANRELEAFSYSVSHDLRAPLRAIDGFGQALAEDCESALDERGLHYLARIRNATQHMARLIDDLLAFSRLTSHRLRHEPIDLTSIAGSVIEELRAEQPERPVELLVQPSLRAVGDPSLLRVVVSNLLRNAWKFTGPVDRPRIEVSAERRAGELVVHVRDNGVGFDPAYGDKLFVPFQRLHPTDAFPGSGVGLATVQRIIHRHGGRVWAAGQVGRGATFSFTLPLREGPSDAKP